VESGREWVDGRACHKQDGDESAQEGPVCLQGTLEATDGLLCEISRVRKVIKCHENENN
jgi:hypothetical protein